MTILGITAALVVSIVLGAAVFVVALRRMVKFDLPREKAERILSECGVSSSSMAVHND
jgi:hypothetical protein